MTGPVNRLLPMPELQVYLLGRFQIIVDNVPVEESRWVRKKARVLLKVLALAPGHGVHREQLLEILWPDMEADAALNNLHKVIHAARRVLEPVLPSGGSRFLITRDSRVALADVWVDVSEFERLANLALRSGESNSLTAALALYRADLLEEDLDEDWASLHRERLRLLHQRVLTRFADTLEDAGDERVIEILHRLLATNRASEDAHRRLMKLYAAGGQRHLALQQYKLCCEALKQDLDADPESPTVRLYERLLAGTAADSPKPAPANFTFEPPGAEPVIPDVPPSERRLSRRTLITTSSLAAAGLGGLAWYQAHRTPLVSSGAPTSLAILPLRTPAGTPQLDSVADGITEELINSISRLAGVRVMARGTVFVYKGRADALAVGRELKVSAVLTGDLSQNGATAAVGMELIDVADGSRLWARHYSAKAANITPLQPLLTSELEVAIRTHLAGPQSPQPARSTTQDAEGYRLYLAGRSYWNQRTADGFRRSIELYKQALDRDPSHALAWAGLADSYGLLGFQSALPREFFPKAREAAQKALQLDEGLAEAQTTLEMVNALYDWNWVAAEAQFRRAIELNRGYATAHHWYGVHLGAQGRLDEASRELNLALGLDPLSPVVNLNAGYPAYYRHRYREALNMFDKAVALNPSFAPAHSERMSAYALDGNPTAAALEALEFLRLSGSREFAAAVEPAAKRGDYPAVLRTWLALVEKQVSTEYVSPMRPARFAAALGDRDKSFLWLDRALQQRSPQLVYLAADPHYDVLRTDPRFTNLLRQIGFPVK